MSFFDSLFETLRLVIISLFGKKSKGYMKRAGFPAVSCFLQNKKGKTWKGREEYGHDIRHFFNAISLQLCYWRNAGCVHCSACTSC